jgi:hypothetical protein
MMRNENDAILDDLLCSWHVWARGFKVCPEPGADPMFRNAKSPRGWDTTQDIIDGEISESTMESIDFEVGEMADPYRSAIYCHARNLASKYAVWSSPRLPQDPKERAILVLEARNMLTRRLLRAGVM